MTGEMRPPEEQLMAGVQEEVRGTDVCVLGRDAKEINAGNMGSMAQFHVPCMFQAGSTAGALLRAEPSPAQHAWVWVGGGFYPTPFKQCSTWEAAEPGQNSVSQAVQHRWSE